MKTFTVVRDDIIKYAIPCDDEEKLLDNDIVSLPKWIRLKAGDKICIVEW